MNVQAFIDNISFPTTLVELEDFIDELSGQSREILFSFFMRRQRFNELQSWKQK